MDAISPATTNSYLRKAAELRREAEKIDDPIVAQRIIRIAERWEERARSDGLDRLKML
jgi:hypothetical protein